jgi:hypothetical protein
MSVRLDQLFDCATVATCMWENQVQQRFSARTLHFLGLDFIAIAVRSAIAGGCGFSTSTLLARKGFAVSCAGQ